VSAASDVEFLRKIQRLLSEGEFVATYKFALLQALVDLSVERALSPGRDQGLAHDVERSLFVAVWAYEQGEQSRAHTYLRKGDLPSLDGSWRDALVGLRAVAETPAEYHC
jgi:hypothetical protein